MLLLTPVVGCSSCRTIRSLFLCSFHHRTRETRTRGILCYIYKHHQSITQTWLVISAGQTHVVFISLLGRRAWWRRHPRCSRGRSTGSIGSGPSAWLSRRSSAPCWGSSHCSTSGWTTTWNTATHRCHAATPVPPNNWYITVALMNFNNFITKVYLMQINLRVCVY